MLVEPIRVHLGPMPEMLSTIIGDLLRKEPDIVVIGRSGDDQNALHSALDEHADVLIVQDRPKGAGNCLETILSGTPLGIFALSADGRNAAAVNLVRHEFELESDRPSALASAVRTMAEDLNAVRTASAPPVQG